MYVHFDYANEGNPYIATTNKRLFEMICKYWIQQTGEKAFHVVDYRLRIGPSDYQWKKAVLRDFAIQWQRDFDGFRYSYGDIADWADFFEECGRKYGLLGEFRENGII